MYKVKLEKQVFYPEGRAILYKTVKLPFRPFPLSDPPLTLVDEYEDHIDLECRTIYYDIPRDEFHLKLKEIICKNREDFEYVLNQYKSVGWEIL